MGNLAVLLLDRGDADEAVRLQREGLAQLRQALGDDHPALALAFDNLAFVLEETGDSAGARAALSEALRVAAPSATIDAALRRSDLALLLAENGELDRAAAELQEALRLLEEQEADADLVADIRSELEELDRRRQPLQPW